MTPDRQQRHLVAILYADVVGFSRMSEADEEGTFLRVRDFLDHFSQTIVKNNGEVIKYAGDAVLAIFNSATDALICAAQVQADTYERNQAFQEKDQVQFRIGLNLGDVIKDRGDVFGDGVNVAARLEALAKPEGICVSGSFHDAIAMKLPFDFEFLGEQQVKNISKPIRAYNASQKEGSELPRSHNFEKQNNKSSTTRVIFIAATVFIIAFIAWFLISAPEKTPPPTIADQPKKEISSPAKQQSIIVLPFDDISIDSDQGYFVDGITEDIITDLSRLSGLKVLARNTSFQYQGKTVDPQQIGQELKVAYMLEGSVRKSGDRIRVTAQLIDTQTSHHLWADRYDRDLTDVFVVQDEVTQNIVKALALHLTDQDKVALNHKATSNIEAYDLFLKGQSFYRERTPESNKLAQETFKEAIRLDPSYARSYGTLALAHMQAALSGWGDNLTEHRARALELAQKAVAIDDSSAQAYWSLSFVYMYTKELQKAIDAAQRSIELSPNYADAYALLAFIKNFQGRAEEAIGLVNKSIDLNPHYTWDYLWNLGFSYYTLGDFEKANEYLQKAQNRNPNVRNLFMFRAAIFMELGLNDEAEWQVAQMLQLYPDLTVSQISNQSPIEDPKTLKRFLDSLRSAGLPE